MRLTRFRVMTIVFLVGVAALTIVGLMLVHEPDFYRRAAVPPGQEREDMSNEFFVKDFAQFLSTFLYGKNGWDFTFRQDQINSFFEEEFVRFGDAEQFRKIGISDPRVEFTEDQIRLGFRYGSGALSTVLSYDLRIWLAKSEVNVLAIEILRRRAGSVPIPTQQVFQEIKDIGRRHNIEIEWYRHNGNPVAIVKFQSDRQRPTAQLKHLEIGMGTLHLKGFSIDPVQNPIDEPIKKAPVQVMQGS